MPFALYGSGTRSARIRAAISPTICLSVPSTLTFCGVSRVNETPAGGSISTGCEKPSASCSFLPASTARYPVPLISRSRAYPVVTPVTMFCSRARVRPCRARLAFSSSLRFTTSVPSSRAMLTFGWKVRTSSPLGPFTRTVCPSIFTSTPWGTVTGRRPIRLISPDVGEDFPAQTLLLGVPPGHDTGRGRDDRDAEAAKHARHLGLARVHAEAGTADAPEPRDRRNLATDVLHLEHDLARRGLVERRDEALCLQDLRDLELRPARWNGHRLVTRARSVAHAREHVRQRVARRAAHARLLRLRGRRALHRGRPWRDATFADLGLERRLRRGRCLVRHFHLTSSTSSRRAARP